MPSRNESKRIRALRRRKERRATGEFLVEGPRVLAELLSAGRPLTRVLYTAAAAAGPAGRELLEGVRRSGAELEQVDEAELRRHAATVNPQGWLATAPRPRWAPADADPSRVLVLDAVADPGNVGTLIRTGEAMGAGAVVILPGTADPWGPKAVRAAAGSSVRVPVVELDVEAALRWLREAGASIWAADAAGDVVATLRAPERVALVLGNEGQGVSPELRAAADRTVAIPMRGRVESLNAAVAGAILMHRLFGG